ncbi:MAG: calcium/sodium antiporter [Alphaproteobacteria bacterium]|jgi:cation:H+ antiporter|nr:calcium/sodium antiporter [Alphaproteobacteria bacterium]MDP6811809.1 calcium/sodium antiporter [Alphaproteobacteria bacterium]
MTYLMVAAGLIILLVGGDVLVRGAVTLARRLEVPPLVIGLTVVAFGTSSPELVVSVGAVLRGVPEIAIGNVVGSNIANILLVLGLPALVYPIACDAGAVRRDGTIMLAISAAFVALCWTGRLVDWQGAIMASLLCGYLTWSYFAARDESDATAETIVDEIEGIAARPHSIWLSLAFILAGLAGLVYGSDLLVRGGVDLARAAGVPEATIGLTLIALGTSLPELATSLVAAIRRHGDVAIGNVIGSNLFNILGIMGITAMVRPVPVPEQFLTYDLLVMLLASLLVAPFVLRGSSISRAYGGFLALAYATYVYSLFHGMSAMSNSGLTQAALQPLP